MTTPHHDVVIIGGGFAGCAAAQRLTQLGIHPVLIEYKWHLGGRTTSYKLKDWPAPLDNGQHVILGCCESTRKFLEDVKAPDAIIWHDTLAIANGDGAVRQLRCWPLPAPFHLIPFLMKYPGIGAWDRAKIAWAVMRMGLERQDNGADVDWSAAAACYGQTEDIQEKFWDPFLVSALNSEPGRAAGRHVRHVVKDAFMSGRAGMQIGIPSTPLITLFNDRIKPQLESAGAVFRMAKRVLRFSLNAPNGFIVHLHDQSALTAKVMILATGPEAAKMILEESTGLEQTAKSIEPVLGGSPIISIHILYDRILTPLSFCQVHGKMIQWIFNKGVYDGQQHVQAVISAADEEANQSQMELVMAADAEIQAALGVKANVVRGVAFVEKNATFPPRPNLERPRIDSTNHPRLFLAGDYVETGWPATIESAVRSGFAAAEAVNLAYKTSENPTAT